MALSTDELERFVRWFERARGDVEDVRLEAAQPATSGFSNETAIVDLSWTFGGRREAQTLVVRRTPVCRALFPDYDLKLQFEMMRAVRRAGIAAPAALWLERDAAILGAPFLVMEFVEGRVASGHYPGFHGHGLFFEADVPTRRRMWFAALEQVAAIHALDWRALGIAPLVGNPKDGDEALNWQIAEIEKWLRFAQAGALPTLEAGLAWVKANRPAPGRACFLWGDARPGSARRSSTWPISSSPTRLRRS